MTDRRNFYIGGHILLASGGECRKISRFRNAFTLVVAAAIGVAVRLTTASSIGEAARRC
jgi:hypothetical protein